MTTMTARAFGLRPLLLAATVGLGLTASGCLVDSSDCAPDLFVDWQIQNPMGGLVTCGGAGAATVVVDIDGVTYPQVCPAGRSYGSEDIPLQSSDAQYDVKVSLQDPTGAPLAVPQETTVNVQACSTYATPGPAILVVNLSTPSTPATSPTQ